MYNRFNNPNLNPVTIEGYKMAKGKLTELTNYEKALYEHEWGLDTKEKIIWLNQEFELSTLYDIGAKLHTIQRVNPTDDPITLHITSYGGDLYSALGLIDTIQSFPVKVNTHAVGACMSAGSLILISGTGERTMTNNTTIMVHEGSSFEHGKTSDVLSSSKHLENLRKKMIEMFIQHTNKPKAFWNRVMTKDTYIDSKQAIEYGIVDSIK